MRVKTLVDGVRQLARTGDPAGAAEPAS